MRLRSILFGLILSVFLIIIGSNVIAADTLNSDWIGTLDKSYELAWKQETDDQHNSYRTQFFLEYTYLMNGTKKYPTYCIEYYLKGPRDNDQYGKEKLSKTNIAAGVKKGIMQIIKNGYPNVKNPYGTKDIAEAYYATSAAVHIWTMYYGIDSVAGADIGWFQYKDGFVMNESNLLKYITDYSTKSTASGWHVIQANNSASSKRTWVAAMKLLIDALKSNISEPFVKLQSVSESRIEQNEIVYEYEISSNTCDDLKVKVQPEISGMSVNYKNSSQNVTHVEIRIPINSVSSGNKYSIYAYGTVNGASDPENYYYLYHLTGAYQTMVYLNSDGKRNVNSSKLNFTIPELKSRIYYDLNYSGLNYVKGGDFNNLNMISYQGKTSISNRGNTSCYVSNYSADSKDKVYNVNYYSNPNKENCVIVNTLLNSDIDSGFAQNDTMFLTFSCWVNADKDVSLKIMFENSSNIYERKLNAKDGWQHVIIHMTKSDYENNVLCVYPDSSALIKFYKLQLEEGTTFTTYISENAETANPTYSEHLVGEPYGTIYNGKVLERSNYTLLGWNTKKNGTGIYIDEESIATPGDMVVYAIWTANDTYKVYLHYGANGGEYLRKGNIYNFSSKGVEILEVPNNTTLELSMTGGKSDCEFMGWSLEDDLRYNIENYIIDKVKVDGKDVHLYANYKKSHRIYYHYYDEKTGSEQVLTTAESFSYNENDEPYLGVTYLPTINGNVISIPSVSDYILKGWSITPYENTEINYKPGELINVGAYEHYYAVYNKDIVIEFYDKNNIYNSYEKHGDDSNLHKKYELTVKMNCSGEVEYASFTIPKHYCEVKNYEFYGWSDQPDFDGSIVYYAEESGETIETDSSNTFYGMYCTGSIVKFYDYDFSAKERHLEKELNAYQYMNYKGETYNPKLYAPYCCPNDEGWTFIGWTAANTYEAEYMPKPEEVLENTKVTAYYAAYKSNISINCHYLYLNSDSSINKGVYRLVAEGKMNSSGKKSIGEVLLPRIESFQENGYYWEPLGYSSVSDSDTEVTHNELEKYKFERKTDLYAVYSSNIRIDFIDYSITKNEQVVLSDFYKINKTCDKDVQKVEIRFPGRIIETPHDDSGWTDSPDYGEKIKYRENDALDVYKDECFYAVHVDTYTLTCNDLYNDTVRQRKYPANLKTYYDSSKISEEIRIPAQGTNNSLEATNYWSLDDEISVDYWSNEKLYINKDIELNAIYRKNVNVIYDANGGKFDDGSAQKNSSERYYYHINGTAKLPTFTPDKKPVRNSYIFKEKWNEDSNGQSKEYPYGVSFTTDKDITLYAMWEEAKEPYLDTIDRYYFVGDIISYEDVISKIVALNEKGESAVENVNITKIDSIDTDEYKAEDIEDILDTSNEKKYKITVEYASKNKILTSQFDLYVVGIAKEADRLRYVSDEYIDTIREKSKWKKDDLHDELKSSLSKDKEEALYKYTIEGEELDKQ